MDETGVELMLGVLAVVAMAAGIMTWWWLRQKRRVAITREWILTDATIESGALEPTIETRAVLPTFAFSYQVAGEYFSGRFGLTPSNIGAQELIDRMTGRKVQLRYDPAQPEVWFIPDGQIEGCKVEQKIGPHVIGLYPRD